MKTLLILLPLLGLIVSCSNIRSKQIVGNEIVDFSEEGSLEIDGEWIDSEGEVIGSMKVTDAKKGEVLFTPAKKEGEEQEDAQKLIIRSAGTYFFINYEPDENGERFWYVVGGDANALLVWRPENDVFRRLIAEGKIKGKNDTSTIKGPDGIDRPDHKAGAVIDDPKGEWVEKLAAGEFGVPFDWQNPTILRKKAVAK